MEPLICSHLVRSTSNNVDLRLASRVGGSHWKQQKSTAGWSKAQVTTGICD